MRIALGFHASKSVNGDSICILFGRSEHRQATRSPKPRWQQVDRQQRHDRQQLVDIEATRAGVIYTPGMIRISRRTPSPRAARASR